jgi:hypothetical protein
MFLYSWIFIQRPTGKIKYNLYAGVLDILGSSLKIKVSLVILCNQEK